VDCTLEGDGRVGFECDGATDMDAHSKAIFEQVGQSGVLCMDLAHPLFDDHSDLRPDFPPAFGRIRRLISGLMRPWFPVSTLMQIPAA